MVDLNNLHPGDRIETVRELLSSYLRHKRPEQLHRLRVEIKKLKACSTFIAAMGGKQLDVERLAGVYKAAGAIREHQMAIQVLESLPRVPRRLVTQLRTEQHALERNFAADSRKYQKALRRLATSASVPDATAGKKKVLRYFEAQKIRAEHERRKGSRKGLHAYRTLMKRLMYVFEMLPRRMRERLPWNQAQIDFAQKKIGRWHDSHTTLRLLEARILMETDRKALTTLRRREARQFNGLMRNIPARHGFPALIAPQ